MTFTLVELQKVIFSQAIIAFGCLLMIRGSYTIYHDIIDNKSCRGKDIRKEIVILMYNNDQLLSDVFLINHSLSLAHENATQTRYLACRQRILPELSTAL